MLKTEKAFPMLSNVLCTLSDHRRNISICGTMKIFNEKTVINFSYPKSPEKEGYLLKKRSENKHSFKRRYFVLRGNILIYSETKLSKEPLGVIFLEGHSVELVDERMFAIHFHTSTYTGRSYVLQAESDAEAEALVHCGSEFLSLSVEELEDTLRALNSGDDIANKKDDAFRQTSPAVYTRNPFNMSPMPPKGRNQLQQTSNQSMSHLVHALALSWEKLHASTREFLDNFVGPLQHTASQHLVACAQIPPSQTASLLLSQFLPTMHCAYPPVRLGTSDHLFSSPSKAAEEWR
nr:hypothetical transcript [Hymenolepis microstoma]